MCVRVDEAKSIRDKAEALRVYAKQVNDPELETLAAAIKLRASRRVGELSRDMEKAKPGPDGKKILPRGGSNSKTETLKAAGLTTQAASRCEKIAAIPIEAFDSFLAERKAAQQPV